MQNRGKWQFSIRSMVVLMLAVGPLAGALSGTFGAPVQEVFIMMVIWLVTSVLLAVISMVLACIIVSPMLIVDHLLRRWDHQAAARGRTQLPQNKVVVNNHTD